MDSKYNKFKINQYIYFLLLLAFYLLLLISENYPNTILKYYSLNTYPVIGSALRGLSNLFPFAIGDVFYFLIVGSLFYFSFKYFQKLYFKTIPFKSIIHIPVKLLNLTLLGLIIFKVLWGLNYARPLSAPLLGIQNKKYTTQELLQLAGLMILKLNQNPPDRSIYYSTLSLEKEGGKAYQKMALKSPFFEYKNPNVKSVLNKWLITKIGIEGYYNPFSGEANINKALPSFMLPFVTCHEIAHQTGIAREDEANLLGYLTCINSSDVNFRYAGYFSVLNNILYEIYYQSPSDFKKIHQLLPPQVLKDIQFNQQFWSNHQNPMFNYMSHALDGYLKLNNQQQGINSYQNIVLWVYNLHKKELTQTFQ